jgi:hypothetical protein
MASHKGRKDGTREWPWLDRFFLSQKVWSPASVSIGKASVLSMEELGLVFVFTSKCDEFGGSVTPLGGFYQGLFKSV